MCKHSFTYRQGHRGCSKAQAHWSGEAAEACPVQTCTLTYQQGQKAETGQQASCTGEPCALREAGRHTQARAEGVKLGSRQIGQETLLKHDLQKGDRNLFLDVQAWAGGTVLGTKQTVQKHIRHIGDTPVLLFAGNGRRGGAGQQANRSGEAAEA